MTAKLLATTISELSKHTCKDATRPHITALHFRDSERDLIIEATDGHTASRIRIKDALTQSSALMRSVSNDSLPQLIALAKSLTKSPRAYPAEVLLAKLDTIEPLASGLKFPPIDQVMPKRRGIGDPGAASQCLQPSYLDRALGLCAKLMPPHTGSVVQFGAGVLDPILVWGESNEVSIDCAIMPMRH